ncbi:hypothetical protein D3C84_49480 [compost metagenome]
MKNRKRNRMQGYDYSKNNLYFVTICVQDRKCCFGNISVGTVGTGRDLSVHVNSCASMNPSISANPSTSMNPSIVVDPYISIMQLNQYGSIVQRQWEWLASQYPYVVLHSFIVMPNHFHGILEIDSSLVSDGTIKIKSLSELVGAFKTTSSKQIRLAGYKDFAWHRSFHDHIIRNDISYCKISNYIDTNALRWKGDVFHV